MPKSLLRILSLILILCVITDPVTASVALAPITAAHPPASLKAPFEQEALSGAYVWMRQFIQQKKRAPHAAVILAETTVIHEKIPQFSGEKRFYRRIGIPKAQRFLTSILHTMTPYGRDVDALLKMSRSTLKEYPSLLGHSWTLVTITWLTALTTIPLTISNVGLDPVWLTLAGLFTLERTAALIIQRYNALRLDAALQTRKRIQSLRRLPDDGTMPRGSGTVQRISMTLLAALFAFNLSANLRAAGSGWVPIPWSELHPFFLTAFFMVASLLLSALMIMGYILFWFYVPILVERITPAAVPAPPSLRAAA
jgi:hypothetical protein